MSLSQEILEQRLNVPFRFLSSVDSTNDLAMQWLRDGAEAGSVVIADEQRKGKGRKGRTWYTPPGVALAVSVILKPSSKQAGRINMIGACAVYDLCQKFGINDIGIKWPNDVQIGGKKVSGILPEAVWAEDQLLGVVLGMGVNVRVQFDTELRPVATNLEEHLSHALNRSELVATLIGRVLHWVEAIDDDALFDTWKQRLTTISKQVEIDGIVGQAQGVDPSGALLIKIANGSIKHVLAGDVHLI